MFIRIFSNYRLCIYITLLLLSILLLTACSTPSATRTPIDMIQPGDTVNGVLITTGNEDSTFLFDTPCVEKDSFFVCTPTFGNPTNVTAAIYGFTTEEVQSKWETFVYTVTIDGQPVDLPAFGTIDFVHERTQLYMRAYNMVLIGTEPITLSVHDKGSLTLSNESWEEDTLIAFEPAAVDDPIQPLSTAAQRLGQHPYTSQQTNFELLFYLPGEYDKDPQKSWPLILYLHGGMNVTSLDWVRNKPIPAQLDSQPEFPFIVASPLHTGDYQHWSQPKVMEELLTLVAELQFLFNINPDQIYLTGWTDGANGVWELGLAHPEIFAALAPAGGYIDYPYAVPSNICDLKDMPIWAFHGEDDSDVPLNAEQMLVEALKACGSNTIQFTTFPDAGHEIYATAYADLNLYTWMLEQSK